MILALAVPLAPVADGITAAASLAVQLLFHVAGAALAIGCVVSGLRVMGGALGGSPNAVTDGLLSILGLALGAVLTFKAPDIAQTVLGNSGPAAYAGTGEFASLVNGLLRWVQRLGAAVATIGYVWHGTFAVVDMAGGGSGARAGELVSRYVPLTLALLALWRAGDIVGALERAFTTPLF